MEAIFYFREKKKSQIVRYSATMGNKVGIRRNKVQNHYCDMKFHL